MKRERPCIITDRAEANLEEIADYIAVDNLDRAFSFTRELRERCHRIPKTPLAAPLAPEFGEGIRKLVHGRYLILYRVNQDSIVIAGIYHSARLPSPF
jgi:plasmid stabilization system protein ParE